MKKIMHRLGIRGKILISVSLFLIAFFIIEAVISNTIFLNGFKNVEEENMVFDIQRVEGLINDQISNYSYKIIDWSNWDDTYKFVTDKNQAYITSNLGDASLKNLKLNFMIFLSTSSAIVYEKGTNLDTGQDMPLPQDFRDLLTKPSSITVHKTLESYSQGIISLSNGFVVFSSRPILTSDAKGPIRGTIIFARYVDKQFLAYIAQLERSKIDIEDYYSNSLPNDFLEAKNLMPTLGKKYKEPSGNLDTYYIKPVSVNEVSGYTIINDYYDKPAFIIKNILDRPFYILGNNAVQFSLTLFIAVSLLSVFFAFILLNKQVLSKIKKLSSDVAEVKDRTNSKQRLDVKGDDEFTSLALNINSMLDEITKSEEDLKKFKLVVENTSDHVIITDPDGKIIFANKAAERLTGYSIEEMLGNTPRLWGKQMPKALYETLWDTIKNKKQPFSFEVTNKKKTGELYPVLANISPILDDIGEVRFFVGVERDISSERKIEQSLAETASMNELMVGRELKMAELKKQIEELKSALGDKLSEQNS